MKAEEARGIATANLKGPVVKPMLEEIYTRVRKTAQEGKFSLVHPFDGIRMSSDEEKEVCRQLEENGYEVEHCPDPDPGHPCSRPYEILRW